MERKQPELSIVVPMYNEEDAIDMFFQTMQSVLNGLDMTWEIIAINDGSKDRTWLHLERFCELIPQLIAIDLSRNFGKEQALTAGLHLARGKAIIPIDADLQDPPSLIPLLIEKWREGYDTVLATRTVREGETWLKKTTAKTFYKTIRQLTSVDIPDNTGDFRLMDRRVLDALLTLREKNRFMKGLFSWVGFKSTTIYYTRAPRVAGSTKWNYWKLWSFALDGIFSFSNVPLKIWTYFGFLISISA
ncbi:MAG: glycosyltransferase family 2 protein, partial [Proteobacteria bacterium]|nr:glycosyltransferase family 2 protein [Pseudomonadota bacterium]